MCHTGHTPPKHRHHPCTTHLAGTRARPPARTCRPGPSAAGTAGPAARRWQTPGWRGATPAVAPAAEVAAPVAAAKKGGKKAAAAQASA